MFYGMQVCVITFYLGHKSHHRHKFIHGNTWKKKCKPKSSFIHSEYGLGRIPRGNANKMFWRDLFWQLRPYEQIHRKTTRKWVSIWSFIDSRRPPVISEIKKTPKKSNSILIPFASSQIHHQTEIVQNPF